MVSLYLKKNPTKNPKQKSTSQKPNTVLGDCSMTEHYEKLPEDTKWY